MFTKVAEFSFQNKEMIMGIQKRRLIDEKRNLIAEEYEKAMNDYTSGRVKTGNSDQLFMARDEELKKRVREIEEGKIKGIPAQEVFARLKEKYGS